LRCELARAALVVLALTATAGAQDAAPIEPVVVETTPVDPPPIEPVVVETTPVDPPAPVAAPVDAPADTTVSRRPVDRGFVLGLELGYGAPGGTAATIYDAGRGAGLVAGYQLGRYAIEWHLLQSYGLQASDPQLRGATTLGTLRASSALVRVRVLDTPLVEVMAGPAMLSTPIFVVGEDGVGDQKVQAQPMTGVGVIAGASLGVPLTRRFTLSLELRAVVAAHWELPGRAYVVPGEPGPDGGRMFTTTTEDATGRARTATVLLRYRL